MPLVECHEGVGPPVDRAVSRTISSPGSRSCGRQRKTGLRNRKLRPLRIGGTPQRAVFDQGGVTPNSTFTARKAGSVIAEPCYIVAVSYRQVVRLAAVAMLALTILTGESARAALIGSFSGSGGRVDKNPAPELVSVRLSIGSGLALCFNLGTCADMFIVNSLDTASVGLVVPLQPFHPFFPAVAAALTNGLPDSIYIASAVNTSVPALPGGATAFGEATFGTFPGPDFAGHTIGLVTLRIDSVAFSQVSLPAIPFTGGFIPYTQVIVGFTLNVYDDVADVPEPASIGLIAAGLASLAWRRGRRALL